MVKNLLHYADNQFQNLDSFSIIEHLQKTFVMFSKFLALGGWGGGGGGSGALVKKKIFDKNLFVDNVE